VTQPVVVAAAVVIQEGRVLLTRRAEGQHLAGMWEFPGGKLEEGESPEAAVVRECREECGIEVEVADILDVTHHRYPGKDVLLLFYRCADRGARALSPQRTLAPSIRMRRTRLVSMAGFDTGSARIRIVAPVAAA